MQPWSRVLVPHQRIYITVSVSYFEVTKAPTQVEDGNFRLSTRFLKRHLVTLLPTNQKKVTHPAALTPNFSIKTSRKSFGSSGFLSMRHLFSLLVPAINLSLLQTHVSVCLASLCIGHTNFVWKQYF